MLFTKYSIVGALYVDRQGRISRMWRRMKRLVAGNVGQRLGLQGGLNANGHPCRMRRRRQGFARSFTIRCATPNSWPRLSI